MKQQNFIQTAMTSGLILGGLMSVNYLLGVTGNMWLGILSWAVIAVIVFVAYRLTTKYRDGECNGAISYGKSLAMIVLSFLFAGVITALVSFVYIQFINPQYIEQVRETAYQAIDKMNELMPVHLSADEIEQQVLMTTSPAYLIFSSLLSNIIFGLAAGLILSIFIKKEQSIFEN